MMFEYVVYGVVVLIVLWILVKVVKDVKADRKRHVSLVKYLVERGAKRVILVEPRWVRCVFVRLYDRDGVFIEELVVRGNVQWFVGVMALALRKEGFEVEVMRV